MTNTSSSAIAEKPRELHRRF